MIMSLHINKHPIVSNLKKKVHPIEGGNYHGKHIHQKFKLNKSQKQHL